MPSIFPCMPTASDAIYIFVSLPPIFWFFSSPICHNFRPTGETFGECSEILRSRDHKHTENIAHIDSNASVRIPQCFFISCINI